MEEITVKKYKAKDGKVFDTEKECEEHEKECEEQEKIRNMDISTVLLAIKRANQICNETFDCADCPLCDDGNCLLEF